MSRGVVRYGVTMRLRISTETRTLLEREAGRRGVRVGELLREYVEACVRKEQDMLIEGGHIIERKGVSA